jgi:hypothetical protein
MNTPAAAPRTLPWFLVIFSLCLIAIILLLMGAPGAANAEPLQQAGDPTITQIPTDTADGTFTLIKDLGSFSSTLRMSMEVDRAGNPVILIPQQGFTILLRCGDPLCTNRTTQNLPVPYILDLTLQPTINGDDLPVILYWSANSELRLDRCIDPMCTSRSTLAIMSPAFFGGQVIAPIQGPVGIYLEATGVPQVTPRPRNLRLVDCRELPCETTTVDYIIGALDLELQLAVVDGIPVMAYFTPNGLAVARCEANNSCQNPTIQRVAPPGPPPHYWGPGLVEMSVNASGNPLITYSWEGRLFLVTCGDPACMTSTSRVYEAMPNSEYQAAESALSSDGDLFTAYDRVDWINRNWPNRTAHRYLMLRRCNPDTLQCTLRNLTNLNPYPVTQFQYGYGGVQELVVQDQRIYLLMMNLEFGGYQISLYVGDQPVVPDPTPGPSPTATATSTLSIGEQTATAIQTRTPSSTPWDTFTPTNTRTPTVTGTLSATPPRPSITPSPTPTFTPSSPPNAAPQRNRYTTSPVTLTWMGTAGQNLYELQIALDASFQQLVYLNNAVLGRSAEVYLSDGFYYWRVRTVPGNGSFSPWSAVDTFVVLVPSATP